METVNQKGRALEAAIAERIRERRLALGWTLERLAQRTGLSKGYLSQIENGDKTPAIGTLTKIAYGLDMDVVELISGQSAVRREQKLSLARAGERQAISHTGAAKGSLYESFGFARGNRYMDSYVVTVSHEYPPKPLLHGGQEMAYTLEGEHEFYYDGAVYTFQPGDAVYFDSDRPHMSRSISEKPAKVLVVFCNPVEK